jgi:hypothetical protein
MMLSMRHGVADQGSCSWAYPKFQEVKRLVGKLQRSNCEPDEALEAVIAAVPLAHVVQSFVQTRFAVS